MIRFPSKQFRYIYWIIFVVWLLISIHVAYMYVSFSSDSKSGKGGTFIEASVGKVNYIPYATARDEDKFYQSLLFNGCVYPSISGTNITYRDELCTITTSDYKSFIVTPLAGKARSDGTPFTLNDIYFTYNTILAQNYRNIPSLDPYRNINILADETGTLEVIFPQASIDNMIFFTNFILPAHLLANQNLETYITTFYTNPVGTSCGRLHPSPNDPNSIVFNLSLCDETLLKYYQVKQFDTQESLETYLQGKQQAAIDLVFSDDEYPKYAQNHVILNKFMTVFFNTKSSLVPPSLRKELATWIHTHLDREANEPPFLVKDAFLFDAFQTSTALTSERMQTYLGTPTTRQPPVAEQTGENTTGETLSGDVATTGTTSSPTGSLPQIPDVLEWSAQDGQQKEYLITTPIDEKKTVTLRFAEPYTKISVSFNDGAEYFPESYDPTTQSSLYNFNLAYRNILQGRNIYKIRVYSDEWTFKTFTLVVHYLSEPVAPNIEATSTTTKTFDKLTVIYFVDPKTSNFIDYFKMQLEKDGLLDFFSFEAFEDSNTFAGKIESGDYDLVIREINMGLRKDISNLFTSDTPNINPSRYIHQGLASAINKYFLVDPAARETLKQEIDTIWSTDVPLVIVGKVLDTINIRSELDFPYPSRLYVLGWRKDFINNLNLFDHLSINRDRLFDQNNMRRFLQAFGQ